MTFTWFDIVATVVLALGVLRGWKSGFIVMVGHLASLVLSVVVSAYASSWLASTWGWSGVSLVIAFIIVALLVSRLAHLVVWLVDKAWKVVSIIPFVGSLNRLLGATVGVLEAVAFLVVVSYVFMNFWMPNVGGITDSVIFELAYSIARRLTLFLPVM